MAELKDYSAAERALGAFFFNIFLWPGLSSILVGQTEVGIPQCVLAAVGFLLTFTGIGLMSFWHVGSSVILLGVLSWFCAWVWSFATPIQIFISSK